MFFHTKKNCRFLCFLIRFGNLASGSERSDAHGNQAGIFHPVSFQPVGQRHQPGAGHSHGWRRPRADRLQEHQPGPGASLPANHSPAVQPQLEGTRIDERACEKNICPILEDSRKPVGQFNFLLFSTPRRTKETNFLWLESLITVSA